MTTQKEFFDQLADSWDSIEVEDIRSRLDRVVDAAQVKPSMRILDVGTGTGAIISSLLKALDNQGTVIAVDISEGMLNAAKAKGFPDNVRFIQADFQELDLPERSFDRVICNAVFPHFTNKTLALRKAFSLLKPGGSVVISHPIGREAVNKIHQEAESVVTEDIVPDAEIMKKMLEDAGFTDVSVVDEPEFYLVIGHRS